MEPQSNQDKLQAQALKLEQEVRDCIAAEQLMNFESGQVLVRWLTTRINLHVKNVTSDRYLKDHTGYMKEIAELQEDQFLLKKIQYASNENIKHKLNTKLSELKEVIKDGE